MSVQKIFQECAGSGENGFTTDTFPVANCRACLGIKLSLTKTTSFDQDFLMFSDKLTACIPEVMWLKEGLPSLICSNCIESLRVAYKFRNVCLQSDQTFTRYISQMRGENESGRVQVRSMSPIKVDVKFECTTMQVIPDMLSRIKEEPPYSSQMHFLDDDCLEQSEHFIKTSESMHSCRACLSMKLSLIKTTSLDHDLIMFSDKLTACIPEVMWLKEDLPSLICSNCIESLRIAYEFRKVCLQSDQAFTRYISQMQSENESDKVQVRSTSPLELDIKFECTTTEVVPDTLPCIKEEPPNSPHTQFLDDDNYCLKQSEYFIEMSEFRNCTPEPEKYVNFISQKQLEPVTGINDRPYKIEEPDAAEVTQMNQLDQQQLHPQNELQLQHELQIQQQSSQQNQCAVCDQTFPFKYHLQEHIRTHTGEKPFPCTVCDHKCVTAADLKAHTRTHMGKKPYSCTTCGKQFYQSGNLKKHLRTHTGEKPFPCTICDYRSSTNYYLKEHMRSHTGEKPYSCTTCGKNFTLPDSLKYHIKTHISEKLFSCTVCDYKCLTASNLKRHVKIHTGEKPYCCTICGKNFTSLAGLKYHISSHTGEKRFPCTLCDYRCITPSNLKRHIQRTHIAEKPQICCTTCGKMFAGEESLKIHIKTHTSEKRFSCTICDQRFLRATTLKLHIRTHTGEKPYSCTTCGKEFSSPTGLKCHIRTHTGEKLFSCTVCDHRFLTASNLKKHVRTHTGEKPYSCTTCGKMFISSDSLKYHIRTHTGEKLFSCTICDYRCLTVSHLNRHMRRHTGEKPYSCTTCGKKFAGSSSLKLHMRKTLHTEKEVKYEIN